MALQLTDGSYLKVIKIIEEQGRVFFNLYRNADVRQAERNEEEINRFEKIIIQESEYAPQLHEEMNKRADSEKTIKENNIIAGYKALKTLAMFEGSIDC